MSAPTFFLLLNVVFFFQNHTSHFCARFFLLFSLTGSPITHPVLLFLSFYSIMFPTTHSLPFSFCFLSYFRPLTLRRTTHHLLPSQTPPPSPPSIPNPYPHLPPPHDKPSCSPPFNVTPHTLLSPLLDYHLCSHQQHVRQIGCSSIQICLFFSISLFHFY